MLAIGAKSLLGCQGSFASAGRVACELVVISSVVPSGSARINSFTARAPPAPGLLSTRIGWPICSPSFWPTMRATTSTPPPGANGTSRRIGRLMKLGLCQRIGRGGAERHGGKKRKQRAQQRLEASHRHPHKLAALSGA